MLWFQNLIPLPAFEEICVITFQFGAWMNGRKNVTDNEQAYHYTSAIVIIMTVPFNLKKSQYFGYDRYCD